MSIAESQISALKNEPEELAFFSEKNKLDALISEALDGTDDHAVVLELTAAVQVFTACDSLFLPLHGSAIHFFKAVQPA
jgi:hypothetical protein